MKNGRKAQTWKQRPGEPNPRYAAFVLYLSLGPRRDGIVSKGSGRQLWQMLMGGIDRMQDDAPLPLVCDVMSAVLKNMLREDALEQMDKRSSDFAFFEAFHNGLNGDEELLAAMETMVGNLEKVKGGEELPRRSDQSGSEIVRDVERFLGG